MTESIKRHIGFYPVVDSLEWIKRLVPLGVPTIQLRIKDVNHPQLESDIIDAIQITNQAGCQLFINDHWQLAIKHQAFGVHLGQEDCVTADIKAIHQEGIHLGISTHNDEEISRVLTYDPFYIAYGPIYHTTSKPMPYTPRGVERLRYWVKHINLPIVAIGGITLDKTANVLATGVDSVAVISAVTQADDYIAATQQFLEQHTLEYA